ncbi:MAG: DNA repair protein RecO [Clostridia bacterium]|nr:DNA repair protein RecO [Clostridia bacterium]
MNLETDGLVIKEQKIGENDRLITLLTSKYGLIRAFVRRANTVKSSMLPCTQLLSYSDFVLYKGKSSYSVNSASPKASFFKLNEDIEALSVGFYLAELFGELAPENDNAEVLLKLLLNSLYLMAEKKRPPAQVKATAELRALSNAGYMPNLVACAECGTYETDPMYFNPASGLLFCSDCAGPADGMQLSLPTVTAMRYICYTEEKKVFNYSLTDASMKELSQAAEQFALQQTGRNFRTLDFLKSIPK